MSCQHPLWDAQRAALLPCASKPRYSRTDRCNGSNGSDDPSRYIDLRFCDECFGMSFCLFVCLFVWLDVECPVAPAVHGRHCMGERCWLSAGCGGKESGRVFCGVLWCERCAPTWRAWAENPWPLHTPVWNSQSAEDLAAWETCAPQTVWGLNSAQLRLPQVIRVWDLAECQGGFGAYVYFCRWIEQYWHIHNFTALIFFLFFCFFQLCLITAGKAQSDKECVFVWSCPHCFSPGFLPWEPIGLLWTRHRVYKHDTPTADSEREFCESGRYGQVIKSLFLVIELATVTPVWFLEK